MKLLEVNQLTVQYGQSLAVKDFDLSLSAGQVIALIGESGSGKTTAIRAIMGSLPSGGQIVKGEIYLEGQALLDYSSRDWQRIRGTKLAMIFQNSGQMINPVRTIGAQFIDYILTHAPNYTRTEAHQLAVQQLEKVQLARPEQLMNAYAYQLSGGMQQRLGIAMATFFRPQVLLADEPTSALDVTTQAQIMNQLMAIAKEDQAGLILVTHNIQLAAAVCDQLIVMHQGRIIEAGPTQQVIQKPQADYTRMLLQAAPQLGGECL